MNRKVSGLKGSRITKKKLGKEGFAIKMKRSNEYNVVKGLRREKDRCQVRQHDESRPRKRQVGFKEEIRILRHKRKGGETKW